MRILFLHSGNQVPSSRFRILPYVRHFREAGHNCHAWGSFPQKYEYFPWMGFRPSQFLKRCVRKWHWLKCIVGRYDIVVIERELFDSDSGIIEQRFRKSANRMVLDVDDAVFLKYPKKFQTTAAACDLVVVGNSYLQDYVRTFNSQTLIIPTCVEMVRYPIRSFLNQQASQNPVIGWMGTGQNLECFEVIATALRNVAAKVEFILRLVTNDDTVLQKIDLDGVKIEVQPWHDSTEIQQLQSFDIGLMPLFPDRDWDRYKCAAKLIQYMGVGVPGIASPVGVNQQIIDHGRNGFLCATTEEWEHAITKLLSNQQLRQDMGSAARETIAAEYSIEAAFPKLLAAFESLYAG